ncbi:phage baseplate protein [Buttiauxella agrestis]|uniref:phage baseplate protein n=1 Tax=Buttiauxella agrestis TaxID=82977 RepID=UPI00155FA04A|nr:hypothetical protein [Buttiauxella agrestis]BCG08768.1 hypothetical protein BADSM9389_14270 [Buttiauxella agrestis]
MVTYSTTGNATSNNPTSTEDWLRSKVNDHVSFLFQDAGDKVFHIDMTGFSSMSFDVIEDETHRMAADVTQFPTEGEVDITDNIKEKPFELSISAFISDTPVYGIVNEVMAYADRFLDGQSRTAAAYNQLEALWKQSIPMAVTTRYKQFTNMAITNIEIRRSPDIGKALVVDMSFRQIRVVSAQRGKVPPGIGRSGAQSDNASKTRAGVKADAGKSTGKSTSIADAPKPVQQNASALKVLLGRK